MISLLPLSLKNKYFDEISLWVFSFYVDVVTFLFKFFGFACFLMFALFTIVAGGQCLFTSSRHLWLLFVFLLKCAHNTLIHLFTDSISAAAFSSLFFSLTFGYQLHAQTPFLLKSMNQPHRPSSLFDTNFRLISAFCEMNKKKNGWEK